MIAIILAGGKGTRLKPYTVSIPKPLLPLGDTPILEIVVKQLAAAGVQKVVLTLGHMAPFFTAFIGNGERYGLPIEYCIEDEPLGTAGPLRLIRDWNEPAIVMNGDLLTTLDFRALRAEHDRRGAIATIALSKRVQQIDYGVVRRTPDGLLGDYEEKPSIPYEVSMGINVLDPRAAQFVPEGRFDMPNLMLKLRDAGETVACYATDCYWKDMGRFDDFQQASEDFVNDPARFLPQ